MISVDLDKIITAQALQQHLENILYEVEEQEKMFVITKKGRPRAALINVDYLEEITGRSVKNESIDYDRYEAAKPMTGESVSPTAGVPESPALDKDIIRPVVAETAAANNAIGKAEIVEPQIATTGTETGTETKIENEADFDLPELSIDDLAFDEPAEEATPVAEPAATPVAAEQPTQPTTTNTTETATEGTTVSNQNYSVPQLDQLLEEAPPS